MNFPIKKIRNNRIKDRLMPFTISMVGICLALRLDLLIALGNKITNYFSEKNVKAGQHEIKIFEDTNVPKLIGVEISLSELYAIYAVLAAIFIAVSTIVLSRFLNDPKKIISSVQRPYYETLERKFYKGELNYRDLNEYRNYIAKEPDTLRTAGEWIAISTAVAASFYIVNPQLDPNGEYSNWHLIGRALLACVVPVFIYVLYPLTDIYITEAFSNRVLKNRFGDSIDSGIQSFEFIRIYLNITRPSHESVLLFNGMTTTVATDLKDRIKNVLENISGLRNSTLMILKACFKIAVGYFAVFILVAVFNGVGFTKISAFLAGSCILSVFTIAWIYLWTLLFLSFRKVSTSFLEWPWSIVGILVHIIIAYQLRPTTASLGEYIFTFIICSPFIISLLLFLVGKGDFSELTQKVYFWKNDSPKGIVFNVRRYLTQRGLFGEREPFNVVAVLLAQRLLEE